MFGKQRLITIAMTLAALALVKQFAPATVTAKL
jgi:hypothetical protein